MNTIPSTIARRATRGLIGAMAVAGGLAGLGSATASAEDIEDTSCWIDENGALLCNVSAPVYSEAATFSYIGDLNGFTMFDCYVHHGEYGIWAHTGALNVTGWVSMYDLQEASASLPGVEYWPDYYGMASCDEASIGSAT